ncbi:esterase-like activity of phytase family protein [uncultured Aliiroseovarius sp.]|uniref:esterase-like activity of phytase family protein n=1 Tax=uncultured Aliiroseovarius sp. TaxID=1658783 RepID=UPI002596DEBC|nr:esterase-like activity of phytase family protein [uncultured Aliiroseovarius sp.]
MVKTTHITAALLCAASLLSPQIATAEQPGLMVEVLDTLTLAEPRIDDLKISELSGLAYDQDEDALFAISDKGRLFRFAIDLTGDRIAALTPLSGHRLLDPNGARMSDQGFNAEDIALDQDGTLAIVSEDGPRIARFSLQGEWIEDLTVPEALRDPAAQRSEKDGLESLALHPTFGLLTAPEEPLEDEKRTTQTIHAATGESFAYDTTGIGTTSIKAMGVISDGRLMILERDVAADSDRLIPWLRLLDPADCKDGGLCPTQVAKIEIPGISDADFEGLTQLTDDLFLIVSDDKIDGDHRSVFGLLRITGAATLHEQ